MQLKVNYFGIILYRLCGFRMAAVEVTQAYHTADSNKIVIRS
jgi:hypothetical protein